MVLCLAMLDGLSLHVLFLETLSGACVCNLFNRDPTAMAWRASIANLQQLPTLRLVFDVPT